MATAAAAALVIGLTPTATASAALPAPAGLHSEAVRVAKKAWRQANYNERHEICWMLDHRPKKLARSVTRAARKPGGAFEGLNRREQTVVWRAARDVWTNRCGLD